MRHSHAGFTLLELLVVIAIAAVLAGLAVPSLRSSIQSAETREAATSFYTALIRARSEAIAHNAAVSVCARDVTNLNTPACATSSTAWKDGWIVFTTAVTNPIQMHEPILDGLKLGTVVTPLVFDATGRVAAEVVYELCPQLPDTRGRRITVSRSGRVSLELHTC